MVNGLVLAYGLVCVLITLATTSRTVHCPFNVAIESIAAPHSTRLIGMLCGAGGYDPRLATEATASSHSFSSPCGEESLSSIGGYGTRSGTLQESYFAITNHKSSNLLRFDTFLLSSVLCVPHLCHLYDLLTTYPHQRLSSLSNSIEVCTLYHNASTLFSWLQALSRRVFYVRLRRTLGAQRCTSSCTHAYTHFFLFLSAFIFV